MRCEYCDVEVVAYPSDGLCVCCGAKLPPKPAPQPVPMQPQQIYTPGVNCCPKCHNTRIHPTTRGFSWILGILGFLFIPPFGLLLGFCGRKKPRTQCTNCNHKWKR